MQSTGGKTNKRAVDVPRENAEAKALACFNPLAGAHVPSLEPAASILLPLNGPEPAAPLCLWSHHSERWAAEIFLAVLWIRLGALFALGKTLDSSNVLIFLLISQLLCRARVSLYASVHFDQRSVTVHVACVIVL